MIWDKGDSIEPSLRATACFSKARKSTGVVAMRYGRQLQTPDITQYYVGPV